MTTPAKRPGPKISGSSSEAAVPERMGKEAWIAAGRAALIKGGVSAVKIHPLAQMLGVTTGSFYWHFKDRQEMLDGLLADWEIYNSDPMFDAVKAAGSEPEHQLLALVQVWLEENAYCPAYDSAVRDWARTSPAVEQAVRRVDDRRIELLHQIFRAFGDDEPEAFVRARITYFHQVGYYALRIDEDPETRRRLVPTYVALLSGRQLLSTGSPTSRPPRGARARAAPARS